jgi:hypothetical protein
MVLGIKKTPDGTKIQNVLVKQIIVVLKFAFVLHVFNLDTTLCDKVCQ